MPNQPTHTKRVIDYWLTSLRDAELLSIDLEKAVRTDIEFDALRNGLLDVSSTKIIGDAHRRSLKGKDIPEPFDTPVLVIPVVALPKHSRGLRWAITPVIIPATLSEEGLLSEGDDPVLPRIPRNLLEPTSSKLVLGDVSTLDAFYDALKLPEGKMPWPAVISLSWQMLGEVSNESWREILKEAGMQLRSKALVVFDDSAGVSGKIQAVYESVLKQEVAPPLLQTFTNKFTTTAKPPLEPAQWRRVAQMHLGSVTGVFPLSPTQRESLYNFLALQSPSILAISGPPGICYCMRATARWYLSCPFA